MTSIKDIKADKAFEKQLENHVVSKKRRTLCISIRDSQIVFSGESNSVDFASENMEHMTVAELVDAMKVMEMEPEELKYKTTETVTFPSMKVKFKGHKWNHKTARDQLSVFMNVLGFGKGGDRKFKKAEDEPEGWPDEYSFTTFEHPGHASLEMANSIIESLLHHHGLDANTHPFLEPEPAINPAKRIRKRKRAMPAADHEEGDLNDHALDQNDNWVDGDDDVENTDNDRADSVENAGEFNSVEDSETGNQESGEIVLSEYERIRNDNMAELQKMKEEFGILPHSKVTKYWKS